MITMTNRTMGPKKLIYLYIIAFATGSEGPNSKVVETNQGPVRGYLDSEGGVFEFYNIPYAKAPTGIHRYKCCGPGVECILLDKTADIQTTPRIVFAPLPPPTWTDTFDAVDRRIVCPQPSASQEDCLIANVFVPDSEEEGLPVIVYVHGGAFLFGHGNMFTPKHLVRSQNVIVVTFNYRLGAHGFLCLGTIDVPGNAGLKDQVAALRWVNNNIINFGGNPDDVTVAGSSAGGGSADLLSISKSAAGLFNKIIVESGASLLAAFVVQDPLENAKIFAASLGFTNLDDIYELENFYKSVSYEQLATDTSFRRGNSTFLFAPCIERDTEEEAFLTDAPINIIKNKDYQQVPMLYGFAHMEGIFREPYFDSWKDLMNENFGDFLPGDLKFENEQQREEVAKKVKEFYFGEDPVNEENILSFIDYIGDKMFKYPILRTVKTYVESGHDQIYLYDFSFTDDDVPTIRYTDVRGATHTAQTLAVLDGKNFTVSHEDDISDELRKVKISIRKLWANFAKTGSPVPEGSELPAWSATNAQLYPYMEITEPLQLRGEMLLPSQVQFWDEIYSLHYNLPIPPPQPNSAVDSHKSNFMYLMATFIMSGIINTI